MRFLKFLLFLFNFRLIFGYFSVIFFFFNFLGFFFWLLFKPMMCVLRCSLLRWGRRVHENIHFAVPWWTPKMLTRFVAENDLKLMNICKHRKSFFVSLTCNRLFVVEKCKFYIFSFCFLRFFVSSSSNWWFITNMNSSSLSSTITHVFLRFLIARHCRHGSYW